MITIQPYRNPELTTRPTWTVHVVGAGGVGARLVPLLVKTLKRGDVLRIIDPDVVSEENLLRQHFGPQDVGRMKAEVLASRYTTPGGPTIEAYIQTIQDFHRENQVVAGEVGDNLFVLLFGAVDNHEARQFMHSLVATEGHDRMYVDMGCALRTGQALLIGQQWATIKVDGKYLTWGRNRAGGELVKMTDPAPENLVKFKVKFNGIKDVFPNLLEPDAEETLGCARRMDTQSVITNQFAATVGFNLGLWWLKGMDVPSVGSRFSASSGASQALPVQYLVSKGSSRYEVEVMHTKRYYEEVLADGGFGMVSTVG